MFGFKLESGVEVVIQQTHVGADSDVILNCFALLTQHLVQVVVGGSEDHFDTSVSQGSRHQSEVKDSRRWDLVGIIRNGVGEIERLQHQFSSECRKGFVGTSHENHAGCQLH